MAPVFPDLTTRQERVLALSADGLGLREIAGRLAISEHTVKKHRDAAVARLGAANLVHAAALYVRRSKAVRRAKEARGRRTRRTGRPHGGSRRQSDERH